MLQVNPGQNKQVAVLLVALVGAIAFVFIRLSPGEQQAQSAPAAAQTSPGASRAKITGDTQIDAARNPFARPSRFLAAKNAEAVFEGGDEPTGVRINRRDRGEFFPGSVEVQPMPVGPIGLSGTPGSESGGKVSAGKNEKPGAKLLAGMFLGGGNTGSETASQPAPKEKSERPSFKLLATIKSHGAYSAVLQEGDSNTRVVEVGDVVAGRFKVARLQDGLAVLTDGSEVIIATRPRS